MSRIVCIRSRLSSVKRHALYSDTMITNNTACQSVVMSVKVADRLGKHERFGTYPPAIRANPRKSSNLALQAVLASTSSVESRDLSRRLTMIIPVVPNNPGTQSEKRTCLFRNGSKPSHYTVHENNLANKDLHWECIVRSIRWRSSFRR